MKNTDDIKNFIVIRNSRVHNLKNLSVQIPRNKLTVVTGVSGSGKSSLAFDTLYAEGQRRYAESLSSYVRQFVGRMDKPDVDVIKGISPAIAIEQKVNTRNPRSTVGTSTEIYDYLKLLYARIGKTYSPISGQLVKSQRVTDVVDFVKKLEKGKKFCLLSPIVKVTERPLADELSILLQKGFSRISYNGVIRKIEDVMNEEFASELVAEAIPAEDSKRKTTKKVKTKKSGSDANILLESSTPSIYTVIDRFSLDTLDEDFYSRLADSVQTAFSEGNGECVLEEIPNSGAAEKASASKGAGLEAPIRFSFSSRFELDGIVFEEPSVHLFSFNNPFGACKRCEGFGQIIGIDSALVFPEPSLSVYDGGIACWRGEKMSDWKNELVLHAYKFDFPVHRPIAELSEEEMELLWTGNKYFKGLNDFFVYLERESYKIQYRVLLSRYRGRTVCSECKGTRLRKDASYVKVCGKAISEIVLMQVSDALIFFNSIEQEGTISLSIHDREVAKRILIEIKNRLLYLSEVGLGYLTLNRLSNTLSGGESQRINLSTALGSSLVGSMYILDEPSIGLHPRDTQRLIGILKSLRQQGNSVIVVEHDEEIMRASDHIIDLGPGAGSLGGELVFEGHISDLFKSEHSLTAQYLNGKVTLDLKRAPRPWAHFIEVINARENTLKNVSVKFPLGVMTVITGVSGSGKSSLVKSVLYPALKKKLQGFGESAGKHDDITGDVALLKQVEFVDQNPIGKSSRSNPVTYVKAYDEIRTFFSELPLAKARSYKPSHFSFNVTGGRCEVCEGSGEMVIEMQFMADIHLTCEACQGKQFRDEVLEVEYMGKNIHDILTLTVDDALDFFRKESFSTSNKIVARILPLQDVGLGYVKLGQPASTLSGGEAQRIKLATFFSKDAESGHTLFLFDEPTTGLHFHDIKKLQYCFDRLVENGHSVMIIEHNPDVIRNADWIIDLGPEGGETGGNIVFEGTPSDLQQCKESYTGQFLKN